MRSIFEGSLNSLTSDLNPIVDGLASEIEELFNSQIYSKMTEGVETAKATSNYTTAKWCQPVSFSSYLILK